MFFESLLHIYFCCDPCHGSIFHKYFMPHCWIHSHPIVIVPFYGNIYITSNVVDVSIMDKLQSELIVTLCLFDHMSNFVFKIFLGLMVVNVCFITKICPYRQQSEHIDQ